MKHHLRPALAMLAFIMYVQPAAHAAGFDCGKARTPLEKTICAEPSLSAADSELNDAYVFLNTYCRDTAAQANLRASQRSWLAGIHKGFGGLSPESLDKLAAAYRARNDELARLLAQCHPHQGPARATVKTVTLPKGQGTFTLVQTDPPEPGWRINKQLFRNFGAFPPLDPAGLQAFFAKHKNANLNGGYENFSFVLNHGNLLVVQVSGTDCEPDAPRCSPYDMQLIFDIRTGNPVSFDDLYTEDGNAQLAPLLQQKLLGIARARLAAVPKADAEANGDQYRRCIEQWSTFVRSGTSGSFMSDGRLQLGGFGNCSNYDPYGPEPDDPNGTALDGISMTVAPPELRPYLSAYGKSLLLGEGDVRAPVREMTACKEQGSLPVQRNDRGAAPGIQTAVGEGFNLLLAADGKLWGWGGVYDGELGPGNSYVPNPILLGEGYAQVGGGFRYAAALRRDGTLWTWGSNLDYRLGDGSTQPSATPVRIGEGYVSVKAAYSNAMALKKDGTVWGWGEKLKTPQQLMAGVKQIEYGGGGERLMLKKDGSLWALGGWSGGKPADAEKPRLIGKGFTRLAMPGADLAYKADGSLWAWGTLLRTTFRLDAYGTQSGDQPVEQSPDQPVDIGSGFVDVKGGGGGESPLLVALKADGSLWLARTRGSVTRMEPAGCGYADAVGGSAFLLALRQDGTLELWGNWNMQRAFSHQPALKDADTRLLGNYGSHVVLGKGFVRLYSAGALALRQDGSMWQFTPPQSGGKTGPKDGFKQVTFPKDARIGK